MLKTPRTDIFSNRLCTRNFDSSIVALTECLLFCSGVDEWCETELNPDKTKFIIIGDKHTRESLMSKFSVSFLESSIKPAVEIKNLGVTFDSENTYDNHIAKLLLLPRGFATHL